MHLLRISHLVLMVAAGTLPNATAFGQDSGALDPAKNWFRPSLVRSESPRCSALLEGVREDFDAPGMPTLPAVANLERVALDSLPQDIVTGPVAGATQPRPYVLTHDQKIYVHATPRSCLYCGMDFYVSRRPVPYFTDENDESRQLSALAPQGFRTFQSDFLLLRDSSDVYYAATLHRFEQPKIVLYELKPDGQLPPVCEVRTTPDDQAFAQDDDVRAAFVSVRKLDAAAQRIAGEPTGCGRPDYLADKNAARSVALSMAVYRPWAMGKVDPTELAHHRAQLARWGDLGLYERSAYARYIAQLAETAATLARFYSQRFGLSLADAERIATRVTDASVLAAFYFRTDTDAFASPLEGLRHAILEHHPLAEIRAFDFDLATLDGRAVPLEESILNVAVEYPEALAYFLERGVNPNARNEFDKTPLMYAAQWNALEAARLLLRAGASSNAKTKEIGVDCNHTQHYIAMTPLHYAVRYASAEFVHALLDAGAAPYVAAKNEISAAMPADWLEKYTSPLSEERNPNMSADDARELAIALKVPDSDTRAEISRKLMLQAEAAYARGSVGDAYSLLSVAVDAAPSERVLSDLSLIALRAGFPDVSALHARRLQRSTKDPRTRASAWFNYGLACEAYPRGMTIEFEYVCGGNPLRPFIDSWVAEPSRARVEKISDFVRVHSTRGYMGKDGSTSRVYVPGDYEAKDDARVFVLHAAGGTVEAAALTWVDDRSATATLVRRYGLGDQTLSEFTTTKLWGAPLAVGGAVCVAGN